MATNKISPKLNDRKPNTNRHSGDFKETSSSDDMPLQKCTTNNKSCIFESSSDDDIPTVKSINNLLKPEEHRETHSGTETLTNNPKMATKKIRSKFNDRKPNTIQTSPGDLKETCSIDEPAEKPAINDKSCLESSSGSSLASISTGKSINKLLKPEKHCVPPLLTETCTNRPKTEKNRNQIKSNTEKLDRNRTVPLDLLEALSSTDPSSDGNTSNLKSPSSLDREADKYIISRHSYTDLDSPEIDCIEKISDSEFQTNMQQSYFKQKNPESSDSEDLLDLCTPEGRSKTLQELIDRVKPTDLVGQPEEFVEMMHRMFKANSMDSAKTQKENVQGDAVVKKKKVLKTVRQLNQLRKNTQ